MIKKSGYLLLTMIPALLMVSCDKYLDVEPKGKRLLTNVADYDLWLNNINSIAQSVPNELVQLSDHLDNFRITIPFFSTNDYVYAWQEQFSTQPAVSPVIWKDLYETIYYFNTVIQDIDEAQGGTPQQIKSLKAEALLGRSLQYLYLVNLYGKPYNPVTAGQDSAVPFVTSNDLNAETPPRSTVKDIYEHIISDINAAVPDLPTDNSKNRFRGTVGGAYSVLARTYLYMGDYQKAALNAQLALDKSQATVLDYSGMSTSASIVQLINRPGTIYGRLFKSPYVQFNPTLDFMKTFNTKDQRLAFWYTGLQDYSFKVRGNVVYKSTGVANSSSYNNCGTSAEEMRLILAECAARANDLPKAINELHLLRKCRFKTADYQKFESAVQEEVIQMALKERTFELAFSGLRWFDMRRLDAEGRMPEVKRYDGQNNVIVTLPPKSKRYTLQIPVQILYFHQDWPQNEWGD